MANIFTTIYEAPSSGLNKELCTPPEGYRLFKEAGFRYGVYAVAVLNGKVIATHWVGSCTYHSDPLMGVGVVDPLPEGVEVFRTSWEVLRTVEDGTAVFDLWGSYILHKEEQLTEYIRELERGIEECRLSEAGTPQVFASLRKARRILAERQFRQRQERRDSERAYLSENGVEIPDRPSKEMWWNIHFLLNGGGLPALLQLFSHKGEVVSPQGKAAWDQYYGPESKGVSFPRREAAIRLWEMLTGKKARNVKLRIKRETPAPVHVVVGNADDFGRIEF